MAPKVNSIGEINYPFRPNGGVNVLNHQTSIGDNQMTRCANMFPDTAGILMKRPGVTNIALIDNQVVGGAYDVTYFPLELFLPDSAIGYTYLKHYFLCSSAGADDGERVTLFNSDTAHYDTRPSIAVGSGFSTNPLSFTNYKGNVLIVGVKNVLQPAQGEGFKYWTKVPTGVRDWSATFVHDPATMAGVPTAQSQIIPVKPQIACTYQGRMVYGNFGVGKSTWLVFADANTPNHTNTDVAPVFTVVGPDVLAFNGRHIELDASGETITVMREVMLQAVGAPVQSALIVLTAEGSCFIGTGIIPETFEDITSGGTLEFQKVNFKCGCVAAASFVKTQFGYLWADSNEVWALINNTPLKIGTLIGNELSKYPPDCRKWWSAAYIDYKYVLQCVISRGSDDRYLQRVQWWLDLTDGLPEHTSEARWYGPHQIARDLGDEGTPSVALGKGSFLSGIIADYDGNRIIGLSTDSGYGGSLYGLSLVDYTTTFGADDIPFATLTGGLVWSALTIYNIGDVVRPSFYVNIGRIFICTTAGTSGASEPTGWAFDGSGHLTDGSVQWTELSFYTLLRLLTTNYYNESYLNTMDILTKDFIIGAPEMDKVLKAVTLYAYSSLTQQFTMELRKNQGAVSNAMNGTNSILATFGQDQNALQSGISQLDQTSIAKGQLEGRSLRPAEGTIHRFKSLQLRITEGFLNDDDLIINYINSGYVLDSTNNSLVFGAYTNAGVFQLFQITLSLINGIRNFYHNIEEVYADIVTAMNAALSGITSLAGGAITISVFPFDYIQPGGSGGSPYFNSIRLTCSSKTGTSGWALFYGNSDGATVAGNVGTFDLAKSKNLMALLGLSTEQGPESQVTHSGRALPAGTYFSPINFAQEAAIGGGLIVYAKEIMPYTRSANIYLTEAVIRARTTVALPLSTSNR